jgi:hypothetical protein
MTEAIKAAENACHAIISEIQNVYTHTHTDSEKDIYEIYDRIYRLQTLLIERNKIMKNKKCKKNICSIAKDINICVIQIKRGLKKKPNIKSNPIDIIKTHINYIMYVSKGDLKFIPTKIGTPKYPNIKICYGTGDEYDPKNININKNSDKYQLHLTRTKNIIFDNGEQLEEFICPIIMKAQSIYCVTKNDFGVCCIDIMDTTQHANTRNRKIYLSLELTFPIIKTAEFPDGFIKIHTHSKRFQKLITIRSYGKIKFSPIGKKIQERINNKMYSLLQMPENEKRYDMKFLFCKISTCKYAQIGFGHRYDKIGVIVCPEKHNHCCICYEIKHDGICKSINIDEETHKLITNDPHTKKCPNCGCIITRIDGCNVMHCSYGCECCFCFRCGDILNKESPYDPHKGCSGLDSFGHPIGHYNGGGVDGDVGDGDVGDGGGVGDVAHLWDGGNDEEAW